MNSPVSITPPWQAADVCFICVIDGIAKLNIASADDSIAAGHTVEYF
ncbi:hypothetical protein [Rhizobium leguminosarum]|nr:hypothetical protein [Rhizobium leguminosarum]MBY2906432.1 hypothetical protein [Rhizobium leguminosarum]MBY2945990.1 hypothetical protein [Rhizobium leguminosarum]